MGSGYLSGTTALLTALRSTHTRKPPDFFFAMTRLEIQGEALTDSMMPKSNSFVSSAETSSRSARGMRRRGCMTGCMSLRSRG